MVARIRMMCRCVLVLVVLCMVLASQGMAEDEPVVFEPGMRLVSMPRNTEATDSVLAITEAYITCDHTMLSVGEETVWTLHLEGGYAESYALDYTLWHRAPTDPADTYNFYDQKLGTSALSYTAIPTETGIYFVKVIIRDQYDGLLEVFSSFYTTEDEALSNKVAEIVSLCRNSGVSTELDVALFMHDYLVDNADYDHTYTHYFPDGVLLYGTGVCQSYATAYKILMDEMGIDCLWVEGTSRGENHAWNMVKIDGNWYHVDCTWDDPTDSGKIYSYFLITDEVMAKDHEWNEAAYPACTDTRYVDVVGEQTYAGFTFNGGFGDITITSYTGTEKHVVVPATINGRKVVRIENGFIDRNDVIETLAISEGVEEIVAEFVSGCYFLHTISLPSTAQLVPVYYQGYPLVNDLVSLCPAMETITVAPDNPYLCVQDNVLYNKEMTKIIYYPSNSKREKVIVADGVKEIGEGAFTSNKYLKTVVLPDSVTVIGYFAFDYCISLEQVNIPPNCTDIYQYAFTETKISEVYIPAATKNIMSPAFPADLEKIEVDENNPYLYAVDNVLFSRNGSLLKYVATKENTSYTVPAGTVHISSYAFEGASHLTEVILPEGLLQIQHGAFNCCFDLRELVIPDTVTAIFEDAFRGCTSLGKLVIPPSVTYIEYPLFTEGTTGVVICGEAGSTAEKWATQYGYAFVNMGDPIIASGTCGDNLTWVLGSDGTLEISGIGEMTERPWSAYEGVIKVVRISEGITSIADWAFYSCQLLETAELPDSLLSIGKYSFYGCVKLNNVDLPQKLETIGDDAFNLCTSLTQIVCPDSVKYVGDSAFMHCSALTSLRLPENIERIGDYFCYGCSSLTSISIPKGVKYIGTCAFTNCSLLEKIEIPEAVRQINREAFAGCTSLSELILWKKAYFERDVFKGCTPTVYCYIGSNADTWATGMGYQIMPIELYDFALPADCVLQTGTTILLGDQLRYEETEYLTWEISDLTVASIQRNALTATGEGVAIITLSYNGEVIDDMTVTVVNVADEHKWEDGVVTIQPQCTSTGLRIRHCESCMLQKVEIVESTGHVLDDGYIARKPTCTEEGFSEHVCTQCGNWYQVTLPSLGHTETIISAIPATCFSAGWTEGKKCSVCGAVIVAQTEIPELLPHTYDNGVAVVPASCTSDGTMQYTCTGCGFWYQWRIPATGHTESEKTIVTAPTETAPGLARISCTACGQVLSEEEIPALGIPRIAGDTNDDGVVDAYDALLVLQYLAGWDVTINDVNADYDGDGTVGIDDALRILEYLADGDLVSATKTLRTMLRNLGITTISIAKQPTDQYVQIGKQARFTVSAEGSRLKYQWYVNRNDGKGWSKLSGAVSASCEIAAMALQNDGYQYRCVITDVYGNEVISNAATLHVAYELPVTGDSSAPLFWLAALLTSAAGIAIVMKKRLAA